MINSIPNDCKISEIAYKPHFSAVCSIGKAPFHGEMEIIYQPDNFLLEFESFERWLKSIANDKMTIEELARLAFDKLTDALGDIPLRVTVHARTTVHAPVSATIERG